MKVLGRIEPQPPKGIKYMLGNQTWLPAHERDLIRLHCEEWGNLGPMELNAEIKPNKAGFRCRITDFIAPAGAHGYTEIDGIYYWTDMNWDMKKPGLNSAAIDGVDSSADNRISVDRGALQMALNVLRRAGKNEVADALAGSVPDGVALDVDYYGLPFKEARERILALPLEEARGMAISLLIQNGLIRKNAAGVATGEAPRCPKFDTCRAVGEHGYDIPNVTCSSFGCAGACGVRGNPEASAKPVTNP